jgi:UDP-glucose 4-epimerase
MDGTGIRDYIHVVDLAKGHLAAINFLNVNKGFHVFNLGTGSGVSVLEIVREFELVTGKSIPLRFAPRRVGDVAASYANVEKAEYALNWKAEKSLHDICLSAWEFQKNL